MRKSKFSDNQGKCCDAILRILEEREGATRSGLVFPEREHHAAPIELVCSIGQHRYAVEHTKLESYPEQLRDGAHFTFALEELETNLAGTLPNFGWFMLVVPTGSFKGVMSSDVKTIRQIVADWITRVAPTLQPFDRGFAVRSENIPGVPFRLTLQAIEGPEDSRGKLRIARNAPADLEALRDTQVRRALDRKLPKLKAWSKVGAKVVLILESEDGALTNHGWVLGALREYLASSSFRPDLVFYVYAIGSPWLVQTLLSDGEFPEGAHVWWPYRQFDPGDLVDVTN